jgi:RimJ/RimL family protein N-acetyltransferase
MPIGAVDVFDYDLHNHTCGLGIFITYPENRKQGHAAIALKKALSILRTRGALLIRAIIYEDNTSSRRLFLSAGFRQGASTFYKGKQALQFFWTPQA